MKLLHVFNDFVQIIAYYPLVVFLFTRKLPSIERGIPTGTNGATKIDTKISNVFVISVQCLKYPSRQGTGLLCNAF